MIFETVLLPIGKRVNERGYRTALADSGSGLVPGDFANGTGLPENGEEHLLSQLTSLSIARARMIGTYDYRDSLAKPQHPSV
jgi:hypothetical protein